MDRPRHPYRCTKCRVVALIPSSENAGDCPRIGCSGQLVPGREPGPATADRSPSPKPQLRTRQF